MSEMGELAAPIVAPNPRKRKEPPPPTLPVLAIAEVAFAGHRTVEQDTNGNFASPEWTAAPAVSHPVAYTRNTHVQLTPTFEVTTHPSVPTQVTVRGTCNFGGTALRWVGNVTVNIDDDTVTTAAALVSDVPLPNVVGCYDPATILWTATPTNPVGIATLAGQSTHVIYAPLGAAAGGVTEHWTLLDVSCRAAAGRNTANDVVARIVNAFVGLNVVRKRDGLQMTYWLPNPTNAQSTADILGHAQGSGQCGAWAELLRDMARVHGIDRLHKVHVEVPPVHDPRQFGFLVKNWTFNAPPAASANAFSHTLRLAGDGGCEAQARLPAQGNNASPDIFLNHYIVYDTSTHGFYDPSYGTTAANRRAWEAAAVDGKYDGDNLLGFFADPINVGFSTAAGAQDIVQFTDMVNGANL